MMIMMLRSSEIGLLRCCHQEIHPVRVADLCHVSADVCTCSEILHQERLILNVSQLQLATLFTLNVLFLALPCLAFGVGRLLHLPSAEAVSVRPNARPQM